jgi:hypothetical protein
LGGGPQKPDRIKKLIPIFEQQKLFLPERINYTDYLNEARNLTRDFVEQEYKEFPMPQHDDMLDCLARILDPKFPTSFPKSISSGPDGYIDPKVVSLLKGRERRKRSFMTA